MRGVSRTLALLVGLLLLAACIELPVKKEIQGSHLHERLSQTIFRIGFIHELQGKRGTGSDLDSIHVPLPLDAVKRRDLGLDRMLTEVAILCTQPEFAGYAIDIYLSSNDRADLDYMSNLMRPIIGNARHITLDARLKMEIAREAANNMSIVTYIVHP